MSEQEIMNRMIMRAFEPGAQQRLTSVKGAITARANLPYYLGYAPVFRGTAVPNRYVHELSYNLFHTALTSIIAEEDGSSLVPAAFSGNRFSKAAFKGLKRWYHFRPSATKRAAETARAAFAAATTSVAGLNENATIVEKANMFAAVFKARLNIFESTIFYCLSRHIILLCFIVAITPTFVNSSPSIEDRLTQEGWEWMQKFAISVLTTDNLNDASFDTLFGHAEAAESKKKILDEDLSYKHQRVFANVNKISFAPDETPRFEFGDREFDDPDDVAADKRDKERQEKIANSAAAGTANQRSGLPNNNKAKAAGPKEVTAHSGKRTEVKSCSKCSKYVSCDGAKAKFDAIAGVANDEYANLLSHIGSHSANFCVRFSETALENITAETKPLVGNDFATAFKRRMRSFRERRN